MEFAWFGHELHMEYKVMKSFAGDLKDLTTLCIFLVIKFYISVLKILSSNPSIELLFLLFFF